MTEIKLDDNTLVALMAAIVFTNISEEDSTVTREEVAIISVETARAIIKEVKDTE